MQVDSIEAQAPGMQHADRRGTLGLVGGALAGIGASLCCLGPLILVSLGVGGAWIANLTLLEPYRWIFVGIALGFMGYAWKRIYRVPLAAQCEPGSACALPQTDRVYRVLFWVVAALVLAGVAFPYFAPLFY
jgi:mercuric ion transport protein